MVQQVPTSNYELRSRDRLGLSSTVDVSSLYQSWLNLRLIICQKVVCPVLTCSVLVKSGCLPGVGANSSRDFEPEQVMSVEAWTEGPDILETEVQFSSIEF